MADFFDHLLPAYPGRAIPQLEAANRAGGFGLRATSPVGF